MIGQNSGTLRLLIIDDSPEDRAVYRRLLSGLDDDFEVAEAESADQGLDLFKSFSPDCILLDYRLPDMTGLEFLGVLATEPANSAAVVMLTGQGDETVAVEAMKWGAQDYLVKHTLTPDGLQQAIQNAVEVCQLRRTIEDQRRQLERSKADLERSNRELERYARVVAHDLEAPLRAIRTGLEGLAQRSGDRLDGQSSEFVQETIESTHRMAKLIRGILDYSRASAPNTSPWQQVDLNRVAKDALGNLKVPIQESGATVEIETLPTVTGDEAMLLQVLQNLIGNGIKYQPRGQNPRVHVSARRLDGSWDISVGDNGIGLDPAKAERIFEPFIRLHAHEYEGTGVGLAVCRAVVERHGGEIWVEGEPGKGSTFHFTLPVREGN
jgi:signal transduction histidine kinase